MSARRELEEQHDRGRPPEDQRECKPDRICKSDGIEESEEKLRQEQNKLQEQRVMLYKEREQQRVDRHVEWEAQDRFMERMSRMGAKIR
jgi:hypothetical protein